MFFHRRSEAKLAGARDTAESPAHNPWYQVHAAATAFGLSVGYTRGEVDAAFRRLARAAHPDVGGTHDMFETLVTQRDLLLKEARPTKTTLKNAIGGSGMA
jgi:hypothetical protein